ncbi:MAG: hypothetical protein FWE35_21335 [Streptosporangiales bacterium]|nr:hypothetical protein [Streptosporangiales bacterium]
MHSREEVIMYIEFGPDDVYTPRGKEKGSGDLAQVSRGDLRWYYFLGRFYVGKDDCEVGPPWGWTPLFDILYDLNEVSSSIANGGAYDFVDFTENQEKINFSVREKIISIDPTYREESIECSVDEFIEECNKFIKNELARIVREYPEVYNNTAIKELASKVGLKFFSS